MQAYIDRLAKQHERKEERKAQSKSSLLYQGFKVLYPSLSVKVSFPLSQVLVV